ncbi:hypothetical protein F511_18350 [Dorcoceras hygrometricum]|uniref:Uncharacterized protein n=1 Tax=Dorcoceras hygrometricum TaxID=472368 RepID=A0A2Z7BLW5_9LAMI|nr:hypothetical protein F511_18350 [Dorcoceras hygrometricum]
MMRDVACRGAHVMREEERRRKRRGDPKTLALIPLLGSRSRPPVRQRKNEKYVPGDDQYDINKSNSMTFIGCFVEYLAGNSCLAPTGFVKKTALHGRLRQITPIRSMTGDGIPSSSCTRRLDEICTDGFSSSSWPETIFRRGKRRRRRRSAAAYERKGRRVLLRVRDTANRGHTTILAPESQFRTCPTDHDSIGYPRMSASGESSTTMHRLLHASGSHPIPTPYDPKAQLFIASQPKPSPKLEKPPPHSTPPTSRPPPVATRRRRQPLIDRTCSDQFFEENTSVLILSGLLVQADEGVFLPVVDLIDESTAAYREEPVFL